MIQSLREIHPSLSSKPALDGHRDVERFETDIEALCFLLVEVRPHQLRAIQLDMLTSLEGEIVSVEDDNVE